MSEGLRSHGSPLPLEIPQLATLRMYEPIAMPGMVIALPPAKQKRLIRQPGAPVVLARLKEKGWKVAVRHLRFVRDVEDDHVFLASMNDWRGIYRDAVILATGFPDDSLRYELFGKGGETTVQIQREGVHATGYPVHEGRALCHPNDNFCRSDGLIVALERALLDAGFRWDEV